MKLTGTAQDIIEAISQQHPEIDRALIKVRAAVPHIKREISEYQAAALYALAAQYNGKRILEIGTAWGYSAAVMASAAPEAEIVTLNPNVEEVKIARENLKSFPNVRVEIAVSWDYLKGYSGKPFDLIFIDGDHKRVRLDIPWWQHLTEGGLMVFHDYSPAGTWRECPPVYEAVNELAHMLDYDEPPVLIVDEGGVGMAGFYKREEKSARRVYGEKVFVLSKAWDYSLLSREHLAGLYALAHQIEDMPGSIVECGSGNGGSAALLWAGAKRKQKPIKRDLWQFDSFDGIPEPSEAADGGKAFNKWIASGCQWCVAQEARAREIADLLKVPDKNLYIAAGLFRDTFTQFDPGPIAFLHIDATLYASTKLALERFYHQVVPNGLISVAAYGYWPGVRKAVDEFMLTRKLSPLTLALDKINIWWKKA